MIHGLRLAALPASLFVFQTTNTMVGVLLPDLARDLQTSLPVAGQLATAVFFAWGVGAGLLAPLSDRYGRGIVVRTGLTVTMAGLALAGSTSSYTTLMMVLTVTAVAAGTLPPTTLAMATDRFPPERHARVLGFMMTGAMLAPLLGLPIMTLIATTGWRSAFYGMAVVFAFLLTVLPAHATRTPRSSVTAGADRGLGAPYLAVLQRRETRLALCSNVLVRMNFGMIVTYLVSFLLATYGVGQRWVALPFALITLGMTLAHVAGGELSRMRRPLRMATASWSASALLGCSLFLVTYTLETSVVLGFLFTFLLFLPVPVVIGSLTKAAEGHRGTLMGLFALTNQAGALLGSGLGGLLLAAVGFAGLGALAVATLLSAAAIGACLTRGRETPSDRPTTQTA